MAENSKIEWTDHTFNPWIGCTKVSDGCKNCYAEDMMDKRYGRVEWGVSGKRIRTSNSNWNAPLKWDRKARKDGKRARVFCASLADVFEDKPDQPEMDEWRYQLLHIIGLTDCLDWLLLTKRPENVQRLVDRAHDGYGGKWSNGIGRWSGRLPPNVWIGTSVENQEQADKRLVELLQIPATVRFLSMEPLLGPVDLRHYLGNDDDLAYGIFGMAVDWVIVGGESGKNARPMNPDWARSLRDQCLSAGVPLLFKQWGEWAPVENFPNGKAGVTRWPSGFERPVTKVGKHAAGRLLDGREWNECPTVEAVTE